MLKRREQNGIVNAVSINILLSVGPELRHLPISAHMNHLSDLFFDAQNGSRTGVCLHLRRKRLLAGDAAGYSACKQNQAMAKDLHRSKASSTNLSDRWQRASAEADDVVKPVTHKLKRRAALQHLLRPLCD